MSNQNNEGAENWSKLTEQEENKVLAGFSKASDRVNVKPDDIVNVVPNPAPIPPIVPEVPADPNYVSPYLKPIPPTVDDTPVPVSDSGVQ